MHFETEERGKRRLYHIRRPVTTVGRDLACDISITSVSVSRRHVEFTREGGTLRFKDLGSRNGVRLNGKPAVEGTLADGDRLSVGEVVLVFHGDEGQAAAEPPAEAPPSPAAPTGNENVPTPLDLGFASQSLPPAQPAAPVPGPAAPPPAAPSSVLKSKRVLWAAAAAVLVVAGAAVTKALMPVPKAEGPSYTPADYTADLHHALQAFDQYETLRLAGSAAAKDRLAAVRQALQSAHRKRPEGRVAEALDRALAFQEKLGKEYATFHHDDAYQAWEEVKKIKGLDPEIETFATDRQKWMDMENAALLTLEKARALAEAGKRDEALAEYAKVPAKSLALPAAQEGIAQLRQDSMASLLSAARDAAGRRDWAGALAALDRAATYSPTDDEKARLGALRGKVQADRQEEADFNDARKAYEEDRLDDAKALLAKLPPSSPYQSQAAEILHSVAQRQALARIRALFAEGKGPETLTALAALPEGTADPVIVGKLRDLVSGVITACSDGEAQAAADRLPEALVSYRKAKDLLAGKEYAENPYRARAEEFLAQWPQDKLSGHYVTVGILKVKKEDYLGAREAFEQARQIDPEGKRGVEEIKKLIIPQVNRLRLDAFTAQQAHNEDLAKSLLEQALGMLRPGDGEKGTLYDGVARDLKALQGK